MSLSEGPGAEQDALSAVPARPGADSHLSLSELQPGIQTGAGGSSAEGRVTHGSATWSAAVRGPGGVTSGPSLSDEGGNPGEEPPTPVPGGGFSDGRGGGRGDGPPSGAAPFEPGGDGDGDGSGANSPLGALSSDQGHRGSDVPASFGREVQVGDLSQASDLGETDVLTEEWVEPRRSLTEPGYVAYLGKLGNYSFVHIDVGTDKPVTFGQEDHTLSLHLPPDASTEQLTEAIDFVHEKTPGYRPGTGASGEFDLHEQLELAVVDYGIKKLPDVLGTDGWNEANRQALGLPEGDRRSFREVVRDKIGPELTTAVLEEHEKLAQGLPRENEASLAEASYVQALSGVIDKMPDAKRAATPLDIKDTQEISSYGAMLLGQMLADVDITYDVVSLPWHSAVAIRLSNEHVLLEDLQRFHMNGPVGDDSIQGVDAEMGEMTRTDISDYIQVPGAKPGVRITVDDFYHNLIYNRDYPNDSRQWGLLLSQDAGMQVLVLHELAINEENALRGNSEQSGNPLDLYYAVTLTQRMEPQFPPAYYYMGVYNNQLGDFETARYFNELALALDPDDRLFCWAEGLLCNNLGDYDNAIRFYRKTISMSRHAKDADVLWSDLSIPYYNQGDLSEAIACLDEAIEHNSDRAEYHFDRAMIFADLDNWEVAVSGFEDAVERAGNNMEYTSFLAYAQAKAGNMDAAREHMQQAISEASSNAVVLGNAGLVSLIDSDLDGARIHLQEAFSIASESGQSIDDVIAELDTLLRPRERAEDAVSLFSGIVDVDPRNHAAWHTLSEYQARLGAYDDALRSASAAVCLSEDNPSYLEMRAGLYWQAGSWPDAQTDYNRLTQLRPENVLYWQNYAWTLWRNGQSDEAVAQLNRSIEEHGSDPLSYHRLGIIYATKGEYQLADAAFTSALARTEPEDHYYPRVIRVAHTQMLIRAGDFTKAEEVIAPLVAANPEFHDGAILHARAQLRQGKLEEALASYTTIIDRFPDDVTAHTNRGIINKQLGNTIDALSDFDHALAVDPSIRLAVENRFACLSELNRHDEAIAGIQEILFHNPNNAGLYRLLATVYYNNDDYASGIDALQHAWANTDPQNRSLQAAIASMIGYGLSKTERHEEAIEASFQAWSLKPRDPEVLLNYARAYTGYARMLSQSGRSDPAERNFIQATHLLEEVAVAHPMDPTAYFELAHIMALQGDIQESRRYEEQARQNLTPVNTHETLQRVSDTLNETYEIWQQLGENTL